MSLVASTRDKIKLMMGLIMKKIMLVSRLL